MPYVEVYVDSQDVIDDLTDDDIIEELQGRGYDCSTLQKDTVAVDINKTILKLYELKRINSPEFDDVFTEFVYNTIGRII
jgi:hypothetical protein